MLKADINMFNGVVVSDTELPEDPATFSYALAESLDTWRSEARAVVWMQIPRQQAELIPIAVEYGFTFHHAVDAYVQMIQRLEADAFVPPFATHYVGAGGVAINKRNELLVVSELHRRDQSRPYYKLPGGALHPGEHISDAVVREVQEETGVVTRFESLVCFRHWHGYRYGKSDIYFICRLRPLSEQIELDTTEIEEARWMPVDEYMSSPLVGHFNRRIVQTALDSSGLKLSEVEGYDAPMQREFLFP